MTYVWAINPFDRNKKLERKMAALMRFVPPPSDGVEAVYVASRSSVELSTAFEVPARDRFTKYPKQLVQKVLKKIGVKAEKVTVLNEDSISLTKSVKALADYLARSHANLVFVASRAKTGLARMLLGSFAESLVHFSPVNLMVFNEESSIKRKAPQSLLYAHDYSRAGDKGLVQAIEYAKSWGCLLHIIHVPEPAYGLKFKGQDLEVERYRQRVRRKAHIVERTLQSEGVMGTVEVDPRWGAFSERILNRADEVDADILMVVAKSNRIGGFLGGSVTRQILRESRVPVLVVKVGA